MIILNCVSLIILTIFEIFLTFFLVKKIKNAKNETERLNEELCLLGKGVEVIFSKVKNIVFKTNKITSILTNKKLIRIHTIIKILINALQIILFLRTLDFRKGIKNLNFKNIKKLFFTQMLKNLLFKIINFSCR